MIDMNKKYTFDGMEGTVLTVTGTWKTYPVVWQDCTGTLLTFTSDGKRCTYGELKLIEVKPSLWVNVYKHNIFGPYCCRVDADNDTGGDRIACVEFKEGEGL